MMIYCCVNHQSTFLKRLYSIGSQKVWIETYFILLYSIWWMVYYVYKRIKLMVNYIPSAIYRKNISSYKSRNNIQYIHFVGTTLIFWIKISEWWQFLLGRWSFYGKQYHFLPSEISSWCAFFTMRFILGYSCTW